MEQKPKLLDQVRDVIRLKHYSIRTERAYVNWIKHFILFHHKQHPKEMSAPEVQAFLTHLAVKQNMAVSTPITGIKRTAIPLPRGAASRVALDGF